MIRYDYMNASDNIPQWLAEQCNRQAVTIEYYYNNLVDCPAWTFNNAWHSQGLDPWLCIEGVDKDVKCPAYHIDYGTASTRKVAADHIIFVQKNYLK